MRAENWRSNIKGDLDYTKSTTSKAIKFGCTQVTTQLTLRLTFEKIEANLSILMFDLSDCVCADDDVNFGYRIEVIGDGPLNSIGEVRDSIDTKYGKLEKDHDTEWFGLINSKPDISRKTHVEIPLDWDGQVYYCENIQFLVHIRAFTDGVRYNNNTPISAGIISYERFSRTFAGPPSLRPRADDVWDSESPTVRQAQKLLSISKTMFKTQRQPAVKLLERAVTLLENEKTTGPAHYMRLAALLRTLMAYARLNPKSASAELQWRFALLSRYLDPFDVIIRGQIAEILICDKHDTYLGLQAVQIARAVHVAVSDTTPSDEELAIKELPSWLFLDVLEKEASQIECIYATPRSSPSSPSSTTELEYTTCETEEGEGPTEARGTPLKKRRSAKAKRDRIKRKKTVLWQEAHSHQSPGPALEEDVEAIKEVEGACYDPLLSIAPSLAPSSFPSVVAFDIQGSKTSEIRTRVDTGSETSAESGYLTYVERVSWVDIADETEEEETARLAPWTAYAKKFCEEHAHNLPHRESMTRSSEMENQKEPNLEEEWWEVAPKRRRRGGQGRTRYR